MCKFKVIALAITLCILSVISSYAQGTTGNKTDTPVWIKGSEIPMGGSETDPSYVVATGSVVGVSGDLTDMDWTGYSASTTAVMDITNVLTYATTKSYMVGLRPRNGAIHVAIGDSYSVAQLQGKLTISEGQLFTIVLSSPAVPISIVADASETAEVYTELFSVPLK